MPGPKRPYLQSTGRPPHGAQKPAALFRGQEVPSGAEDHGRDKKQHGYPRPTRGRVVPQDGSISGAIQGLNQCGLGPRFQERGSNDEVCNRPPSVSFGSGGSPIPDYAVNLHVLQRARFAHALARPFNVGDEYQSERRGGRSLDSPTRRRGVSAAQWPGRPIGNPPNCGGMEGTFRRPVLRRAARQGPLKRYSQPERLNPRYRRPHAADIAASAR